MAVECGPGSEPRYFQRAATSRSSTRNTQRPPGMQASPEEAASDLLEQPGRSMSPDRIRPPTTRRHRPGPITDMTRSPDLRFAKPSDGHSDRKNRTRRTRRGRRRTRASIRPVVVRMPTEYGGGQVWTTPQTRTIPTPDPGTCCSARSISCVVTGATPRHRSSISRTSGHLPGTDGPPEPTRRRPSAFPLD